MTTQSSEWDETFSLALRYHFHSLIGNKFFIPAYFRLFFTRTSHTTIAYDYRARKYINNAVLSEHLYMVDLHASCLYNVSVCTMRTHAYVLGIPLLYINIKCLCENMRRIYFEFSCQGPCSPKVKTDASL